MVRLTRADLVYVQEWKSRLPRFLFRGFHARSGGNSALNGSRLIQPHAFHGANHESWPGEQVGGTPAAASIDIMGLRYEINGHLGGIPVKTHFSSWAADFETAIRYAAGGERPGGIDSAMIAVLDTTLCDARHTAIYHVPALKAAGISQAGFPHEYLVYGPVVGAAYCCCVSMSTLRREGLVVHHLRHSPAARPSCEVSWITRGHLDHASKIASLFGHEMYKLAGPALFLTVFAAELSRHHSDRVSPTEELGRAWSRDDALMIFKYLWPRIEDASMCDCQPLVNPKTYVTGFRQLGCMVQLLTLLEEAIRMVRSKWAVQVGQLKQDTTCPKDPGSRCGKRKAEPDPSTRPPKRVNVKKEDEKRPLDRADRLGEEVAHAALNGGVPPPTARAERAQRRARRG